MTQRYLLVICLVALSACGQKSDEKYPIEDTKMGLINANVESEETNFKVRATYPDRMPGSGQLLERAFENAPPQIPHSVSGFLPITMKTNACVSCHSPEVAKKNGATTISKTHFMSLRPQLVENNGLYQMPDNAKVQKKPMDKLNHAYYNCSQCHVPQAKVNLAVESEFERQLRNPENKNKSTLVNVIEEGTEK